MASFSVVGNTLLPVAEVNEQFMAAFSRGDAAAVAALYAEHGQLLPPLHEPLLGRAAIQAFWQTAMDEGFRLLRRETFESETYGDTGIDIGRYLLLGACKQVLDKGKYVIVWKQVDGRW